MNKRGIVVMAGLALLLPLGAQQQQQQPAQQDDSQTQQQQKSKKKTQQQQQPPADDQSKPKPLFGGSVSAKSSSQKKDTTSLGFNGLDPEGKIEKAALASSPTSEDEAKVEKIAQSKVDAAALQTFLDDGHLKTVKKGGQQ